MIAHSALRKGLITIEELRPEAQKCLGRKAARVRKVARLADPARLLVEADGLEFHSGCADYRKDQRRANAYCRLGWRLLRFSRDDVRLDPE